MNADNAATQPIRIITVFLNGTSRDGIYVTCIESNFDLLLDKIKSKLSNPKLARLFNKDGAEISELEVIKDQDVLYVSDGEGLVQPSDGAVYSNSIGDRIKLNVGGTIFETSRAVLLSGGESSMLSKMFDPSLPMSPARLDGNGGYFIDRDPNYFAPILNFLRTRKLIVDPGLNTEGVLEEASYFGVDATIPDLDESVLSQLLGRITKLEKLTESGGDNKEILRLQKTKLRIDALSQLKEKQDLFAGRGYTYQVSTSEADYKFGEIFEHVLNHLGEK